MNIQEKSRLGLRILKYLKADGCEIQLVGRSDDGRACSPSVTVYRLAGDWTRKFQEKTGLFKYTSDRFEVTHEKFLAGFAEWYCSPRTVDSFRLLAVKSGGKARVPIANSPEELSLHLAVHGY